MLCTPITTHFGASVRGVDLNVPQSEQVRAEIRDLLYMHRLLVFKDQGKVSAESQLEVSRWFGGIESTFFKHPRSPHPDVFRVSNDEAEGCRNVGRSGWHIDGVFMPMPFQVQTMHFWSVSKGGNTLFSPLHELVESLPTETRAQWERLWFVGRGHSAVHPLIYRHPMTGRSTLCFHCGEPFVETFARDYVAGNAESVLTAQQTQAMLRELTAHLEDPSRLYAHEWSLGDFAIIDNLAVAHYAHPDTQAPPEQVGLRILHRTTVAGRSVPEPFRRPELI